MESALKKIFSVFAAAAACFFCGCASFDKYYYFDGVAGCKWVPVYVAGTGGVEIPPDAETEFGKVYISFSESGSGYDIKGMSGCNIFHGGVELKGGREIEFEKMLHTNRKGKYAEYELKFLQAISKSHYMVCKGQILYFSMKKGGGEIALMRLRKEPL